MRWSSSASRISRYFASLAALSSASIVSSRRSSTPRRRSGSHSTAATIAASTSRASAYSTGAYARESSWPTRAE